MAVISLPKKEYEVLKNKAEKYDWLILQNSKEATKKQYDIKDLTKGFNGKEKEFWNYPPIGKEVW